MAAAKPAAVAADNAGFAEFFAAGWRIGASDPERFFAHFADRMAPDALMEQPLASAVRGPDGFRSLFTPLFSAIPNLRGEVVRSAPTDDGVMVELKLSGNVGQRSIEWTVVDRLVLRGGLLAERRSYFDPFPLIRALSRHPVRSLRLARAVRRG